MAFYTDRNDVKPMLFGIAIVVMVLLCRMVSIMAFQNISPRQCSNFDSAIYSVMSFKLIRMAGIKTPLCGPVICFTHFGLSINPLFAVTAYFTIVAKPIFSVLVFVEFRKWFELFARRTSFRYSCLRHGFSPIQKSLCLEPFALPIRVCGSFYYDQNMRIVK